MKFKEIYQKQLKSEDFLWRYIDFHKLIDLAINKALHFTRIDQFSDPFEGVTYELLAKRYIAKRSNITNPKIKEEIRKSHNELNKKTIENFKKESKLMQKTQFVNCWLKSSRESVAMWNLYSNRDSVAIKVDPKKIIEYFKKNLELQPFFYPANEFICGSVKYLKLNPFDPFENPDLPSYSSFKKEAAYDYEREFRFLIATPKSKANSNPKSFRFDISKNFIELLEIICHPEMDTWKYKNLSKLCSKLDLPEPNKSRTEIKRPRN